VSFNPCVSFYHILSDNESLIFPIASALKTSGSLHGQSAQQLNWSRPFDPRRQGIDVTAAKIRRLHAAVVSMAAAGRMADQLSPQLFDGIWMHVAEGNGGENTGPKFAKGADMEPLISPE